jgi:hypothetical protein
MISPVEFSRRLDQRSFTPFHVRLTNGLIHVIRHPEQAIVTSRSAYIGMPKSENDVQSDSGGHALVSLLHVVQIDPIASLPGSPPADLGLPVNS